jgi:peptide methionine sulfoxide reductase MsrB
MFKEIVSKLQHGHGHVYKREDGVKARCGGPSFCEVCKEEVKLADELLAADARVQELKQRITQYS